MTDSIESLSRPIARRTPINVTIREDTDIRLNKLVAAVQAKNPAKKKSHLVDQILSEKLDQLKITAS